RRWRRTPGPTAPIAPPALAPRASSRGNASMFSVRFSRGTPPSGLCCDAQDYAPNLTLNSSEQPDGLIRQKSDAGRCGAVPPLPPRRGVKRTIVPMQYRDLARSAGRRGRGLRPPVTSDRVPLGGRSCHALASLEQDAMTTSIRALLEKIWGVRRHLPAASPGRIHSGNGGGMPLPPSEDHFKSAFVHSTIGMALVSLEGRWLQANAALSSMLGYSADELLQTTFQALTHPEDLAADLALVRRLTAGEIESYSMEKRYFHKQGHTIYALLSVSLVRAAANQPRYFISQIQDITARKRYEEDIRYLANHDPLTGLASATLLDDRLATAMARTSRSGDKLMALLFVDLDRFKVVNDSLGHAFGDRLLKMAAERLQGCMRSSDTVARRGGDEFVVLVEDLAAPEDALFAAHKIQQALARPMLIDGKELVTTATIGAALYPADGNTAERLLTNAEAAMHRAKLEGGGGFNFYTAELGRRTLERFGLESALRQAVSRGEFELYYQPQVRLADRGVTAVEALIRWHRPGHGLVLPARFIALAEETGL